MTLKPYLISNLHNFFFQRLINTTTRDHDNNLLKYYENVEIRIFIDTIKSHSICPARIITRIK